MFWVVGGVLLTAAVLSGPIASDVEQAKYEILEKHEKIELRKYQPMIIAEVEVTGERKEAINKGFKLIADYIFGNNTSSQKIAMTAPVLQNQSEKIAMTAPVVQENVSDQLWKVHFVMPASYSIETLPRPNNNLVKLKNIESKRFVVIKFSGMAGNESIESHTLELKHFVDENRLTAKSLPIYAFYNPPWTLGFLRRNEIMLELE